MNVVFALLLIGATGEARREVVVDQHVSGIVARVVIGAVSDGIQVAESAGGIQRKAKAAISVLESAVLTIDGEPRTGWRAWGEAGWRVGAYAIDARHDGSVGLAYRLRIRRYNIATSTAVSDGSVVKQIDAWWTEVVPVGRSTREIPIHVSISIRADEVGSGTTRIVGTATGTADTSDFACGLVRRIAERKASETLDRELDRCLVGIQRKGTDLYHGADEYTNLLDGIGSGIRTIGRLRR